VNGGLRAEIAEIVPVLRQELRGSGVYAEAAPEFLSVPEAAEFLRLNRKTLYEQIQRERPAWAIRFGRSIRISRTALLAAFGVGLSAPAFAVPQSTLKRARGNRGAALGATK
jgi:excisionase family DNA binding protein